MSEDFKVVGIDDVVVENVAIDDLESEVVNLIFLATDQSGSMNMHRQSTIGALGGFKQALTDSKEADEILVSRANFNNGNIDVQGYKRIDEFDCNYDAYGNTPLYDVVVKGANELLDYMKELKENGMRPKAVFGIFSDGLENGSRHDFTAAKKMITELHSKEVITAFISFGSEAENEARKLGIRNILTVGSTPSELRRAFNVFSKSVIEASKSVVVKQDGFYI